MKSIIKNMSIITNEIVLTNNNITDGPFQIKPNISRRIGKVNNEENKYGVELHVLIKDEPDNRFPINLSVKITGIFEIDSSNELEVEDFLKSQGVQMLFPYLRSMVSSVTAGALITPIMLPIIQYTDFKESN